MIGEGGNDGLWGIEWFVFRPTPHVALPLAVYDQSPDALKRTENRQWHRLGIC